MPAPASRPFRGTDAIVLDTDVLYRALRPPGRKLIGESTARTILRNVLAGEIRVILTTPLFKQYEDVLRRPGANDLPEPALRVVLDRLCAAAEKVTVDFRLPALRDAGDTAVLEAAVAGRAAAVVTTNVRDFGDAALYDVAVLTPAQFPNAAGPDAPEPPAVDPAATE